MSFSKFQLGIYQIILLSSRAIGFARDFFVLLLVGATALADDTFFLLAFSDVVMAFIAGGGAALYLVGKYSEKKASPIDSYYWSATTLYVVIAMVIIVIEVLFGQPLGNIFYNGLGENESLTSAYKVSLLAILLGLPIVSANAVFLFKDKIYLQPAMNILFTLALIAALSVAFIKGFDIKYAAYCILVAAFIRYVCALAISKKNIGLRLRNISFIKEKAFYKELLLAGLGIGFLILIPFIFRSELTQFGEGIYVVAALSFKVNDLAMALFIIPVTSLILKNSDITSQKIKKLIVILLAILIAGVSLEMLLLYINQQYLHIVEINDMQLDVIQYSLTYIICAAFAYVVSMVFVRKNLMSLVNISSLLALVFLVIAKDMSSYDNIVEYYGILYSTFTIYMLLLVSLYGIRKWYLSKA